MAKQKREPVYMVQEWIECPKCHGYGVVARIIDFETQAWPCDNCNEDGHLVKDVPLEEALRNLGIVVTQKVQRAQQETTMAAPQPDWSKAPQWAKWHAIEASGRGYWFPASPLPHPWGGAFWYVDGIGEFDAFYDMNGVDFTETLTSRPQEAR